MHQNNEYLWILCLFLLMAGSNSCTNNTLSCLQCTNGTCSLCQDSYYQNGTECLQCHPICKTCSNYYDCTSCLDGFKFDPDNYWCWPCQSNCKSCADNLIDCTTCYSGYYMAGTVCSSCKKGCASCTNSSDCFNCSIGHYHDNGECLSCIQGCAVCTNTSVCVQCLPNFYMSQLTCVTCGESCINCTETGCMACGISVNYGFFLLGGTCFPCFFGCNSCNSSDNCNVCPTINSYKMNGTCFLCPKNCLYCQDNFGCISCLPSYFNINGTCQRCPSHCYNCSNEGACLNCFKPIGNQTNNCTVINPVICSSNSYISNGTCVNCSSSCLSCQPNIGCQCADGTYLNSGKCLTCQSSCVECMDQIGCLGCVNPSYYLMDGQCVKCPVSCKKCDDGFGCLECIQGYFINEDHSSCLTTNFSISSTQGIIIIVGIVVGIIGIILIIIALVIFYRRATNATANSNPNVNTSLNGPELLMDTTQDTLRMEWKKGNVKQVEITYECSVCHMGKGNLATACKHRLHHGCFLEWAKYFNTCQVCKTALAKQVTIVCSRCNLYYFNVAVQNLSKYKEDEILICVHCQAFI